MGSSNKQDNNLLTREILDRLKAQCADIGHIKETLVSLSENTKNIRQQVDHLDVQLKPITKVYNFAQVAAKILAVLGTLAAAGLTCSKLLATAPAPSAYPQRIGVEIQEPALVQVLMATGGLCTGFVIAPNTVVTAAHCAEMGETGVVAFRSGITAPFKVLTRGVPASATDVEVLAADTGTVAPLQLADSEEFPEVALFLSARGTEPTAYPAVLAEIDDQMVGAGMAQVIPGDSGSPVIGKDGKVRGVVIMCESHFKPLFWFVTLQAVQHALADAAKVTR